MENLTKKNDLSNYISEDNIVRNRELVSQLRGKVLTHEVFLHPILSEIENIYDIPLSTACSIHCDYRHAIVQVFTDALLAASLASHQLETLYKLPAGAKMIPRFLLAPNILDEFGLKVHNSSLVGSVNYAHYPLFEEVMNIFSENEQETSTISQELRAFLEHNYNNYANIIALLAVVELQVICFTPVLEKIIRKYSPLEQLNYYSVHGSSSDNNKSACDDEHEDALWDSLALIIDQIDINELIKITNTYLNLWNDFWFKQLSNLSFSKQIKFIA